MNFKEQIITMMSLELNEKIKIGVSVLLAVKPTNIILSKENNHNISCENILNANIVSLNNGDLLSSIELSVDSIILESIICFESSAKMNLAQNDKVDVLINASDISIQKIIND